MANAQGFEVNSPVGKLVQGSVWELQDQTEDDGKTPKRDEKGNVMQRCYFAVAVRKDSPEWLPFWNKLVEAAASGYPQYFQNGNMPGLRDFAWKVTDGDGFDKYGKPNNAKPGFAGCWVIKFSSSFLPRCYEKGKYAKHEQLQDSRAIRPGFFIRVGAIVRPNIGSKTHGLYLNSDLVSLEYVCAPGDEITFGRDASEAFGGAQQTGYVPPGAAQLPAGGMGNGMMPNGGGAGSAMPSGGGNPMGGAMPGAAAMPGTAVQSQTGFAAGALNGGMPGTQQGGMPGTQQGGMPGNGGAMPNAGGVPGTGGMGTAMGATTFPFNQPAQRQLVPTAKAAGYTLEQFYANGFDEARVVNEGFFTYAS